MKLQNNQTGQVENFCIDKDQICSCDRAFVYDSLAQLQEAGWEDYDKPKGIQDVFDVKDYVYIQMGSEEEAGKAVEKVRAWKRLKDKGFQFESWFGGSKDISFWLDTEIDENIAKDLDLLFGGEE